MLNRAEREGKTRLKDCSCSLGVKENAASFPAALLMKGIFKSGA
jgi:hypothetical protein